MYDDIDEDYYKPIRTSNAFSSNYIEYESNGDKGKTLSIEEYFDEIRPYLNSLIDSYRTQGEWKVQLSMIIKFLYSKDSEEIRTMYNLSDNIETMTGYKTDEIVEDHFDSFLKKISKKN